MIKFKLVPIKGKTLADPLKRMLPTKQRMDDIGAFAYQQVYKRFQSWGASGGKKWDENWLNDPTNFLKLWEFFDHYAKNSNTAIVYCSHPFVDVQEYGTKGKGGIYNTITPKKAKALFIPISLKAKRVAYASRHRKGRMQRDEAGNWFMVKRIIDATDLIKGRIAKGGGFEAYVDGEWIKGITPDFIFLNKVDIPPRPMLPTSSNEQADLADKIREVIRN